MSSNRFYILMVCVPTYLLPFLPPIRKQFILESQCGNDYISIYMIVDKFKVEKPVLFYGIYAATLRCNVLNDDELNKQNRELIKNKTPETVKIAIELADSTELLNRINLKKALFNAEKNPDIVITHEDVLINEMKAYEDISIGDLKVTILNDSKHNLIPTENEEQTELFNKFIKCFFEHRISLISSMNVFVIKSVPTLDKKNKSIFKFNK